MYAGDLTLLSNNVHDLQVMLNFLAAYAEEKGLTVNVSKSKVAVFNAGGSADPPGLTLGGQRLEVVNELKYLGVIFERSGGCTARGAEQRVRAGACFDHPPY